MNWREVWDKTTWRDVGEAIWFVISCVLLVFVAVVLLVTEIGCLAYDLWIIHRKKNEAINPNSDAVP
jgi:hypothetical protein